MIPPVNPANPDILAILEQLQPPQPIPDRTPRRAIQGQVEKYVRKWMNASREFVERKVQAWHFDQALADNLVILRDFLDWQSKWKPETANSRMSKSINQILNSYNDKTDEWRSQFVWPCQNLVLSWVANAYEALFSNSEFVALIPLSDQGLPPEADLQADLADRVTVYLHDQLEKGKFRSRIHDALVEGVLKGTCVMKVYPHYSNVTVNMDDGTEEQVEEFQYAFAQMIPLERFLPDWRAETNDPQSWSGVGHVVERTREEILAGFENGLYNTGKNKFLKRWPERQSTDTGTYNAMQPHDQDAEAITQEDVDIKAVWEWHGEVPTTEGLREFVVTMVEERESNRVDKAVMVKCEYGPFLRDPDRRPFTVAHYIQKPGPFGDGQIKALRPLIEALSRAIARYEDCVNVTANPATWDKTGSDVGRQLSREGGGIRPGDHFSVDPVDQGDPIGTIKYAPWPASEMLQYIDRLINLLDRETAWSQISQGSPSAQAETAAEAAIAANQAQLPTRAKVDLFCQNLFDPVTSMILQEAQANIDPNKPEHVVWQEIPGGQWQPVSLSAEELSASRWQVKAIITKPDAMKTVVSQQLERLLQISMEIAPAFQSEGKEILITELFMELAEKIADRPRRFVRPLDQNELYMVAQQMAQQMLIDAGAVPPPEEAEGGGGEPQGESAPMPASAAPPEPQQVVTDGGPMGGYPTDSNALAQLMQEMGRWMQI